MDVFDLVAKLTLDTSGFEDKLGDSKEAASGFGKALRGALGTAGKAVAAGIAAVGTATVAAGAALVKGAGDVAAYGDTIDKMSQKLGMSAEAYQEWDAVLRHSGTSIETMQSSMKTLATAAETGNKAFSELGITEEELGSLNQQQLFERTISALQNMESDTERTYLAGKLLGRGATELGALLNTSAEDTQAMRDRVHELGGVMSDDAVKASAAFQDSLQDMQTAMTGMKNGALAEFLPSITTVMDGLADVFSGGGTEKISEGISKFVGKISEAVPKVMKTGSKIVLALVQAISENLPTLLTAGSEAIMMIATGLIEQLPQIISSGLEVILALANGIAESLPELIPTIVETVLAIVDGLIENADSLVDAAIAIIMALAEGLISALPTLIEKAPEIIVKFVAAIIENVPKLLEAAATMMADFGSAIQDGFIALLTEVGGWVQDNILTPLSDSISGAVDIGSDIVNNLLKGIQNAWSTLTSWVKSAWERLKSTFHISSSDVTTDGGGKAGAVGMDYVPANGFPAILHRGEAVLTRSEADEWRRGNSGSSNGIVINQYVETVPQTPVEFASATAAMFEQARWAFA